MDIKNLYYIKVFNLTIKMGIDYDSRLIFGWEIDYKTMYSYAEKARY